MMSMLLTSTNDAEVEYWTAEIKLYQEQLERHSVAFATTKLAAARMSVLNGSAGKGREMRAGARAGAGAGAFINTLRPFCDDFRVDFV
jgi:hypothetical protein